MDEVAEQITTPGGKALDKLFTGEGQTAASPDFRGILASAPTLHEVLARPMVYEAWLKKAQEALNG